jgi:outer membrane protein assembly factor BamB
MRRRAVTAALVLALVVAVAVLLSGRASPTTPPRQAGPSLSGHGGPLLARWTVASWLASLEKKAGNDPGHLQPGSNPAVLPGPVLIADRNNSRLLLVDPEGRVIWSFPNAGSLGPGQTFVSPDDAFFTPDGNNIVVTQESDAVLTEISLQSDRIVWRYGHPGVPGSQLGYLHNPDDAMGLPNGNVISADIMNCRLLYLSKTSVVPLHIYGVTDPNCYHEPPLRFGSPNGMFPMSSGDWLVTEIDGDWVDDMNPAGRVLWSVNPPGITYPSDTNEVRPGVFLTSSYTDPGAVEEFNQQGQLLWQYAPTGPSALDKPSLALALPNGDVILNDDWNDRVIVIDPHTDKVVWQYGVAGVPGSKPGYLHKPDGIDLAPPYSMDVTHAATMGIPPFSSSPSG